MSTALFTPIAGQQGTADGTGDGAPWGAVGGAMGYTAMFTIYAMKVIVEQTLVPVNVDPNAVAAPVVGVEAFVPLAAVNVDPQATGTPRGRASTSAVPLRVGASSTATGRIRATAQAVIRWGAAATGRPRVIVQALIRLINVSATAIPRVIAQTSVPFPIKWVASSFAKQPPRVVRILQNLSRTVIGPADDASRTKIGPVADRTTPTVRVRDDSETQ